MHFNQFFNANDNSPACLKVTLSLLPCRTLISFRCLCDLFFCNFHAYNRTLLQDMNSYVMTTFGNENTNTVSEFVSSSLLPYSKHAIL